MKRPFIAAVLVILWSGLPYVVVMAVEVDAEERALMDEIVAVQREREKLYGNMHAVWAETRVEEDGTTRENLVEFWSREHKYYRVDIVRLSETPGPRRITRTVVRPDRYARMHAFSRDKPGAFFEVGGADELEEGMKWIRGDAWYCQANKSTNSQTYQIITDWLNGESFYESYHVSKLEDGTIFIEGFVDAETNTAHEVFKLSPEDYRFLESKSTVDYKDDEQVGFVAVSKKVYEDQQRTIPVASSEVFTHSDGQTDSLRYELKEYQLEPAPLEVFDLPDFVVPRTRHWARRLMLLLGGASLLGTYFLIRLRKKRTREPSYP